MFELYFPVILGQMHGFPQRVKPTSKSRHSKHATQSIPRAVLYQN